MRMKGKNVRRHRFNVSLNLEGHPIEVSTRFSETTRAGRAAGYLSSGEIDRRSGVEVAITCLFAPLREAQEGATEDEIEQSIAISQAQWVLYMDMARNRCRGRSGKRGATTKLQSADAQPSERVPESFSGKSASQLSEVDSGEDDEDGLDLDNEVF
jgi:hypothetical protein